MKPAYALIAALPLFLSACIIDLDWQTGNGIPVTEKRALPAFTRISSQAPVHVVVKTGSDYAAYVTSDENLVAYFETEAQGGLLTLSQPYAIDPVIVPVITVTVPDLRAVENNGMGLVEIEENGDFPDLSLTLNGGGEIRFSGTASRLRAELNGAGRIYAEGYAAFLEAALRGQGEISAENLLASDAEVELSGSGNIYLDLDYGSELALALSGSGRVEWWGAPSKLDYSLTGTGKVVEHRGLPKQTAGIAEPAYKAAAKVGAGSQPYEIVKKKE